MKAFTSPPPGVIVTVIVVMTLMGDKASIAEADKEKMWKKG